MDVRRISLCGAALMLSFAPAMAQDTATHNRHNALVKGASIAIEGCLAAGQKADTYVLGAVKEIPGAPIQTGKKRVYWIDDTALLHGKVGQVVLIAGRIRDLDRREIEVELGAGADGGAVATIDGPGGAEVETKPAAIGVGTTGADVEIPITMVKIDVDSVKVVRACGP